jgi:uncharacterized protein (TIGR02284 family)
MTDTATDALTRLHTDAVDARNGYDEALKDSDSHSLFTLFESLRTFHSDSARELAAELTKLGAAPSYSGSLMSVVHQSIIKLRSLFGGLDQSVLPGLIDGEKRNLAKYDEAIGAGLGTALPVVERQRSKLAGFLSLMEAETAQMKASA